MSTARILTLLAVALLLAACGSQQSAIQTAIAQTSQAEGAMQTAVAQTLTALLTQTAAAQPPAATATETPTAAPADTSTPSEFAPDPLPASHTGVVLNVGECFDFDSGQVLTSAAAGCDMWQPEPALVRQMNGASISGYVTFEVPSKSRCVAATYDPNDLAIQTDLYMCLMTNEGAVGFLVARSYLGGVPMTGFAFDYWLFP
jgi:hypothetical protein